MKVTTAQHPTGDDRVFSLPSDQNGPTAVVMLDGASSFVPVHVKTAQYVDALSHHIGAYLTPETELRAALRQAIAATAEELSLVPRRSPCSTVTIIRQAGGEVECLILGDNLVALPGQTVTDDRMAQFGNQHRARYQQRLSDGHGWDTTHAQTLKDLQAAQLERRNQDGGYWIAEAIPEAADHALVIRKAVTAAPWAVLATDGAYKLMGHLGTDQWDKLTTASQNDLDRLLSQCQDWEYAEDPNGQKLPRAKKHDDKSLAVAQFSIYESDASEYRFMERHDER